MKKISDRYRTDELHGPPEEILILLKEKFWDKLPNLNRPNPKVLVVFSGSNGVGKSTLSNKISQELDGLVIENDAIKRVLISDLPELNHRERGLMTWEYTMYLFKHIDQLTENGLIVRDSVIDWYFDRILPIFEQKGYKIFVIGFDVSDKLNRELITKRGDTETVTTELLLGQIEEHKVHIDRFRRHYKPNIVLSDKDIFDHEKVLSALREFMSRIV